VTAAVATQIQHDIVNHEVFVEMLMAVSVCVPPFSCMHFQNLT
jgi:hypothetical protein